MLGWILGICGLVFLYSRFRPQSLGRQAPSASQTPKVSIIVPARNEEHHLGKLLSSLSNLTYADYEVIVVDEDSEVLAVGRAVLSGIEMKAFKRGVAVKVRHGCKKES